MTFYDAAHKAGCILTKDDIKYLRKMMYQIPYNERRCILSAYLRVWVQTMAQCENALRKQNAGRRAANLWLMEQVNRNNDAKR